jgi:hypothetical protein
MIHHKEILATKTQRFTKEMFFTAGVVPIAIGMQSVPII